MKYIIFLLAMLSIAATCSPTRSYKMGIAGITPAHWPNPTTSDWSIFVTDIAASSDFLGVHSAWNDHGGFDYGVSNSIPMEIVMGVTSANVANLANIVAQAKAYAASPLVKYLCIGNENQSDPNWNVFSNMVNTVISEVKTVSPSLQTCTVFQYEASLSLPNTANLIASLNVDYMGYTTYPLERGFMTVESVPQNYYAALSSWSSKPLAITETGWPSQTFPPLGGIPQIPGSEAQQNAWLTRLISLLPTGTRYLSWLNLNDFALYSPPYTSFSQVFETMALRTNSGSPKTAYTTWINAFKETYVGP